MRGKVHTRGSLKRADYVLYYKNNVPLAVVEAKDNKQPVGSGLQQALVYAEMLGVPFAFSSNGDGFLFHDGTAASGKVETQLGLDAFPSPEELWERYKRYKGISSEAETAVLQDFYTDGSGKAPRYYQLRAINRTVEAIAKGQNRALLIASCLAFRPMVGPSLVRCTNTIQTRAYAWRRAKSC